MADFTSIAILIPAYNPDEKLTFLVEGLIKENFKHILIINDGSKMECERIFDSVSSFKECEIVNHAVNLGKGRALKTGFNYLLNTYKELTKLVTVDADGQHSIKDIKRVAQKLANTHDSLVLGVRNFSAENIPFRSRFGNKVTEKVFRFASGVHVSDTQTGLRGISYSFLKKLMNVKGERFEYEMNMLLECKANNISIEEVEIETIYLEENKSSHFNPIADSIKIYSVFFKYISSSLLSFGLDILFFSILLVLLQGILPTYYIIGATIGARVLSSLFNYMVNRNLVFHSKSKNTLVKYYTLSVCQMCISALGVYLLYLLIGQGEVAIKIAVDTFLFIISFYIQREWVFKKVRKNDGLITNE
ncbi:MULTISPECIES: bifunctional glycosyltransferase family 2/GtrA family protein [Bacillus]|uniref:Glycosyl transferase n=2 Tax=Bacillus TaxID=1386 RepID=A0A0M3RA54_9BACI|nr:MULTISPECIES: bifunctional glycosyltransferase family 2/GtrA family protein [Bacillus]ALC82592.1 hypothetical protein AM592_14165 [Bacillus gobiensis]MBP1081522.1 glycosyltransferase involved in cell wall biosynthesis [Bacillus capparidis]MED1096189.1 glycosyltransferase [Bacillus capparidis]